MEQTGSRFFKQHVARVLAAGLLFVSWTAGAAPVIRSGAEPDYPPLSFVNKNGAPDGFSIELLRETLAAMGREVSFETAPWAELKQKLADGALDVLPLVGRTPEREALYDFTVPYLTLHGALFVREDETAIESLADLPGKTIAVMKGDNAEEYVLRENLSEQVVSTSTYEEAFRKLSRGAADAVIAQKLMGVTLLKKTGIPDVRVTGRPNEEFKQNFCFAVPKGNRALLSILNEGLALTIQDGTQQQLKQKWLGAPFYDSALARPLVYGGDRAFPPYEYLDENGDPAGFNIEIARALARELGVDLSFRMEPWSEIRREMDAGEIDLAAMFYSEGRDQTIDFSVPLAAAAQAVFAGRNSPSYTGPDSLRGKRISVQNGDLVHDYLLKNGFTDELVIAQNPQDALRMLVDGEVDFSACALLQGRYWMERNEWRHLRAVDKRLFVTDYCLAVPHGNTALLGRINEGLVLLKESGEYRKIYNKWLGVLDAGVRWEKLRRILLTAGGVLALTAMIVLWFVLLLRRQVRKKTVELRSANSELDQARNEALNKMQETVRANRKLELTQFALDSSSDTVFWIAPDGHFTFINQAACERLGYSRDELLSMSVMDIDPDFPTTRWPQHWEEMKASGAMRFESRHKTRDGHIFPVEIFASFISRDGEEYIFAFVHDITARKEQQQALEESNCRLEENNRDLLEARQAALNMMEDAVQAKAQTAKSQENLRITLRSIGDAVISTDVDGRVVWMNPIAESLTGWTEADATGHPLGEVFVIINEQSRQTVESPVEMVLKTGQIVGLANHTLLIAKDGNEIPIADSGAPIKNAGGETTGVVLVFRDQTKERATRQALEDSEARLQRAQKIALVGDWEFDLRAGTVSTSQSAKEIYGLPDREMTIQEVQKIPLPEYRPVLDAALKDLIKNGTPYDVEFAIRRPSDQAVVDIHSIAEYNPETQTVFGVIQNITERKEAELALAESREELEAMWSTMDVGIALINAETRNILRVNPALLQISGYSEDELLNHVCHDVICPACEDECPIADLHQVLDHSERELKHKEGCLVPIEKSVTPITLQGREVYVETIVDITNIKQAEGELLRLSTAIEQSPETVVITDTEGTIEYVNPAFETVTGYTKAEVIGQNPRILQSGKQSEAFYADMWRTLEAGEIWNGRMVNKRKDGTLYSEDASIAPVRDRSGATTHFVAVKRDITAELAREKQMQKVQKMEAVGQLAGGIAHDFNNILQAISGFSDLLLMHLDPSDDRSHKYVQEIQKAAKHAAELTNQLLSFSRKQEATFKDENVNEVVQNTETLVKSVLGENIRMELRLNPQPLPVNIDRQQIERCIMNMALNARDAMPDGGTLTLQTKSVAFSTEEAAALPSARPGRFACLSIADSGTGIPKEAVDHIFEPFFTTKDPGKGTGLGLAAIYGIIQEHKGWIHVYSEPGKGSTFKIYLPVHETSPAKKPSSAGAKSLRETGAGERILIVEDDPSVRALAENALSTAGYQVDCVSTAEDAVKRFNASDHSFSLLISDVILPKKNGAELAAELLRKNPELPVILCSGYSGDRIQQTGIHPDDFFFLEKPFEIADLLDLVHTLMKGSR